MANPEYDWNGTEQHQVDPLLSNRDPAGSPTNDQFKAFHIIRPDWIKLEQEIGEGCFGKVYRGSLITSGSPENVAVKVLKGAAGPSAQEELLQEAEIMASFSHSNILALKGIVLNGMLPRRSLIELPLHCHDYNFFLLLLLHLKVPTILLLGSSLNTWLLGIWLSYCDPQMETTLSSRHHPLRKRSWNRSTSIPSRSRLQTAWLTSLPSISFTGISPAGIVSWEKILPKD